jgi:sucrose phosphorylase
MKRKKITERILLNLEIMYGKKRASAVMDRLEKLLQSYESKIPRENFSFTESDAVLITYGDSFQESGGSPLQTLSLFLEEYLTEVITIVHVLPFFPYSSDDGFSVIDYRMVNPELGSWEDIRRLSRSFKVMFDAVINHISAGSGEFHGFLQGDSRFDNFFIAVHKDFDISRVFRPRALPLLTTFDTERGSLDLWTTFSTDQIDLNYENPEVLLYIIDVLLFYVTKGASMIRLDAIAFLWKESGTECLHLPQTHAAIKLMRAVFDLIAPHVKIITETNVPHSDNISYFGSGDDEAHMVYNFALPPLTAHALLTGDASYLTRWASGLQLENRRNYFYNFTASHDGIGLMPVRDILPAREIEGLADSAKRHGGELGLKDNPDGSQSVYELNISLFDLVSDPEADEPLVLQVARFVASQAIAMSLAGVPAFYYHSLVGSRNYYEGVKRTGVRRAINREKLQVRNIREELNRTDSLRSLVFESLVSLLKVRKHHRAFHPEGRQVVHDLHPKVFAVERIAPDEEEKLLALINVAGALVAVTPEFSGRRDVITGERFGQELTLDPYGVLWLV